MVQTVKSECAYDFTVPEKVQVVAADCAYDFIATEMVDTGEVELSLIPVSGQICGSGEYCILNWTNDTCTGNVSTYGVNTTTRIYGRCASFEEYYNICKSVENGEFSMTVNRTCHQENTYCSILWGNSMCEEVRTYGVNTQTDLYGVCLSYDGKGDTTCPFK
ncbi:MAG: hypothetical protein IKV03_03045 [Alphaproteobacteria bacterium]|nr:hypothetical protein [Alphaproteobacteria bacterium]